MTVDDARHAGLPLDWYRRFVERHFDGTELRAEQLRLAVEDPSVRALLRYKNEQRRLVDALRDVLDEELNPYDAIAAGVADPSLARVVREVFPGRDAVTVRELLPEVQRRAVRTFLIGADGRPSIVRVRRATERAQSRRRELAALGALADRRVGIRHVIQAGAADEELLELARRWFGESESLSVGQLLLASQVPAFARVLGWQKMMANV